jgi:hypothetical protein
LVGVKVPDEVEVDDVDVELAKLYRERDRLQFASPPTPIRVERAREQRERVEHAIARLEAMRQ